MIGFLREVICFTWSSRYRSVDDKPYPHRRQRDSRLTSTLCILKDEEQETSARISVILPPEQHFLRIDSTDIFTIIIMATVAQIYMQKVGRAAQEITYCACVYINCWRVINGHKILKLWSLQSSDRSSSLDQHSARTKYEVGGRWLASFPGSFQQRAKTAAWERG